MILPYYRVPQFLQLQLSESSARGPVSHSDLTLTLTIDE